MSPKRPKQVPPKPVRPVRPVPVKPVRPVPPRPAPVKPVKPVKPVRPEPPRPAPVKPVKPVKPVRPVPPKPVPVKPIKPVKPVRPEPPRPAPVKPVKPVKPVRPPITPPRPGQVPADLLDPAARMAVIEAAVRFIEERAAHHSLAFAMEVGEHLFVNVYGSDPDLVARHDRMKGRSIASIARDPRVGMHPNKLYACIQCYLARTLYAGTTNAPVPDLTPWKWDIIYERSRDDPDTLVAIADWVATHDIRKDHLNTVMGALGPYLRSGGSLDDILTRTADTPYDRMLRIVSIIPSHVSTVPPSERRATLALLDALIRLLESPSGSRRRPTRWP